MKIVVNAYSARQGGGQTYPSISSHTCQQENLEVRVFAPASLELPVHSQVRRVHASWPITNPLARALWEHWVLPGFLRRERADASVLPGWRGGHICSCRMQGGYHVPQHDPV